MRDVRLRGLPHDFVGPLPGEIMVLPFGGVSPHVEAWMWRYGPEWARIGTQQPRPRPLVSFVVDTLLGRNVPIYIRLERDVEANRSDVICILSNMLGDGDLAGLVVKACFSGGSWVVTLPFAEYWRSGGVLGYMERFCSQAQTEGPVPEAVLRVYRRRFDLLARECHDNFTGRRLRRRLAQIAECQVAFEELYASRC